MDINLPDAVLAVGALGTAAFGLVDATKALWGGISQLYFLPLTIKGKLFILFKSF